MTTRRGEPIETERESVEEILRPLAEQKIRQWLKVRAVSFSDPLPRIDEPLFEEVPDPRFEALRLLRGLAGLQGFWRGEIAASLGAIVRAAAACGLNIHLFHPARWPQGVAAQEWTARLDNWKFEEDVFPVGMAAGATPEETAARALVAAVRDEKAAIPTVPRASQS